MLLIGPGQVGDSPMLPALPASLRVPRQRPGRPRNRPGALLGRKAYSARAHRAHLRSRGITAVIPERADQIGHRSNRGSAGGRPVTFDPHTHKSRNVVERAFNKLKNWRGLATRYDKHAVIDRGGMVLAAIVLWLHRSETRPGLRPVAGSQATIDPRTPPRPVQPAGTHRNVSPTWKTSLTASTLASDHQQIRLLLVDLRPISAGVPVDLWHGWLPLLTLEWKDFPQGCRSGSRSFVEMLSGPDGGS